MAPFTIGEGPAIHPQAEVVDSTLGAWTAVYERASVAESTLGDYTYVMNDSSVIYAEIGKFCSIASHTRLNPGNHPLDRAALHHFSYRSVSYALGDDDDDDFFEWRRSHRVILDNDVWIGHGATVLPGVHIGTGAAVGAGAVVTRDVPPFAVVAGVPAKVIRFRFGKNVQDGLLRLAWWDWSHEKLQHALPDFRRLNAEALVRKYGAL